MGGLATPPARGLPVALLAWGRLLRLSLAPTAAADVMAGLVLGGAGHLPSLRVSALLVGASLCIYHANLILNDWRDRAADARTRPERPLPSGAVAPAAALTAAVFLCAAGTGLAALIDPRAAAWLGAVGLLAVLYNLAGRGPWSGPLLIAACRAGNLGLGLFVLDATPWRAWLAPAVYGAYVCCVARLGRLEDGADEGLQTGRPRRLLWTAAALLVLGGLSVSDTSRPLAGLAAVCLTGAAAAGLVHRARIVSEWSPAEVQGAMGLALRRLLVMTAAFALASGPPEGQLVALGILLGYPLSWGLRGAFPPS